MKSERGVVLRNTKWSGVLAVLCPLLPANVPIAANAEQYPAAASSDSTPNSQIQGIGQTPAESPSATARSSAAYRHYLEALQPAAPAFLFSTNIGITEVAIDNARDVSSNAKADLNSAFSIGETVTADTPRLSGILTSTTFYRKYLENTDLDGFTESALAKGKLTILPSSMYVQMSGAVDDLDRQGGPVENNLLEAPQSTRMYNISAGPVLALKIEDLGSVVFRYRYGQVWFEKNTNAIQIPGLDLGPLTGSSDQLLREDIRTPGTLLPRLLSDLSVSSSENNGQNSVSGDLRKSSGELINEYEITRWGSIIGGAGYEILHDNRVPSVNGGGKIWDAGTRLRPNADSYILVVYGRHDRHSDFAGEMEWRITPLTDVYADYTDALTTTQQTLIGNHASSELGPNGLSSRVSYDQSTIIGVLDQGALNEGPGGDASLGVLGIPIGIDDSLNPLQNGLFRARRFSASARTFAGDKTIVLTAYYIQNTSLTPPVPSSAIDGTQLSLSWPLAPRITATIATGYNRLTGFEKASIYHASMGADFSLSNSISVVVRYDYHSNQTSSAVGFAQNAITVGIHKTFD